MPPELRGQDFRHLQRYTLQLLDWLTLHRLTLQTARQGDLDRWLTSDGANRHREAGHFIRWAKNQKLTTLELPAVKWTGPQQAIDTEARWEQARRLLHDDTLKPEDRVAGLFVLLYAQWPAAICRLTADHVTSDGQTVRLLLGDEPIELPEPLAGLVLQLVATRQGHARLGDQGTSRWLFPGGEPERHISSYRLTERLRQLGLRPAQDRSAALFQLSTELPAALLAPDARHPHHRRGRLATSQRRRLGRLRRRSQPTLSKGFYPTMTFQDHLRTLTTQAITSITASEAADIYAISFFIENEDDDPRQPTLTIGYNTETQARRSIQGASDQAEARWNYAFWIQNQLAVIGDLASDPIGAATREEWIRDLGLWYDEPTDPEDWTTVEPLAAQIEAHFNQACCHLARTLHEAKLIEAAIGRPVPVIVHELEYYEEIARRTELANPPGLADEFIAWVRTD
jgi:hypothetical protein